MFTPEKKRENMEAMEVGETAVDEPPRVVDFPGAAPLFPAMEHRDIQGPWKGLVDFSHDRIDSDGKIENTFACRYVRLGQALADRSPEIAVGSDFLHFRFDVEHDSEAVRDLLGRYALHAASYLGLDPDCIRRVSLIDAEAEKRKYYRHLGDAPAIKNPRLKLVER